MRRWFLCCVATVLTVACIAQDRPLVSIPAPGQAPPASRAPKIKSGFPLLESGATAKLYVGQFDNPTQIVGSKGHATVYYDPALGPNGLAIAKQILAASEIHYGRVAAFFRVPAAQAPKVNIILARETTSAGYHYVGLWNVYTTIQKVPGTRIWDVSSAIYVAELTELFSEAQGKGWADSVDHGEALSRFVMASVVPKTIGSLDTVALWFNAGAPDYISRVSSNYSANGIGCGMCFLYYLRSLGYKLDQIIAIPAPSLEAVFRQLTGRRNGYAEMMKVLYKRYPAGSKISGGLVNDNLFDNNPPPVPKVVVPSAQKAAANF